MNNARPTRRDGWRRGAAAIALVVLLAVVSVAVVGTIDAAGDETAVAVLRVESARSLYAAESGARVVMRLSGAGRPLPAAGSTMTLEGATVTFQSAPAAGKAGDITVIGASGYGQRRVRVTVVKP